MSENLQGIVPDQIADLVASFLHIDQSRVHRFSELANNADFDLAKGVQDALGWRLINILSTAPAAIDGISTAELIKGIADLLQDPVFKHQLVYQLANEYAPTEVILDRLDNGIPEDLYDLTVGIAADALHRMGR